MTSPDLKEDLDPLVAAILGLIEAGRRDGSLVPSEQTYFQWRLQGEIAYGEQGVKLPSAHGETIVRQSWAFAAAAVARDVLRTKEYWAAAAALQNISKVAQNADQFLQRFVSAVARMAFESDPPPPRAAFDALVGRFLDDIAGSPFECGAEVRLEGLALESEQVEPFPGIVLRRPKREDFEAETPYFGPGISFDPSIPGMMSAVVTVTCKGTAPRDVQRAVEKLIVMLRLSDVMSAKYISYQLYGGSVIHFVAGRLTAGGREVIRERRYLRTRDEQRLLKFWRTVDPILPKTFYDLGVDALDYRDMAYDRYNAALMHPGSFEERVANAIMAFEALLLEEHQELSYRLRLRAAKMLSFLGEEPLAVRDALAEGYSVSSAFAHGSRLSGSGLKRIEGRYQSVDAFVLKILTFVRRAIVAMLLVRESKDHFIALIDDALLDHSAEDRLRQLLSPAAELL